MHQNYGYDDSYDEYSFQPKRSVYGDYDGYDEDCYDMYLTDDDYLDNINACSAGDCTGLVVNGTVDIKQPYAYEDIYNYSQPQKER